MANDLLSTRCERAGPDEQPALLIELVRHVAPEPPWKGSDNQEYTTWYQRWCQPFNALLAIGTDPAYLAAAMMLVPEGWYVDHIGKHWRTGTWEGKVAQLLSVGQLAAFANGGIIGVETEVGEAATPALALCAAVARSMGQ